jgi:hypothetical protein
MKGYDTFFEKPGEIQEHNCMVCGSLCSVQRNQLGSISWASAMAHKSTPHDYFYCPHIDEDWHTQAEALVQAIENTPSKRVAELMKLDLEDILKDNL